MLWVCVCVCASPVSSFYAAWAGPIMGYIILPNHLYFFAIYALLPAQILFLKYKLFLCLVALWRGVAVQFLYLCRPLNQSDGPEVLTKHSIR